ncbi:hypothetical protein D9758_011257 [Tetrapyrgos nigripes]|uniref:Uncharacterized protein n=1 Tax=Tetrapyrgos nigripes TaxID=182062 RepID=A0A8H5FSR4_9AGAR|nr:hypothetical protein D9758_011257 [Tetrapyrgos nigripes]
MDKVVYISGANGVIGEGVAISFAQAGANVVIGARRKEAAESARANILKEAPKATVIEVLADVCKPDQVEAAVKTIIEKFGRLDVAIAVAGKSQSWELSLADTDPNAWWEVIEVNIRGVYNVAKDRERDLNRSTSRYTLPYLNTSKGYFIAFSSMSAQLRIPNASSYSVSKHAVTRFVEFVTLENPNVKAYSFHPGGIRTPLSLESIRKKPKEVAEAMEAFLVDKPELPAATLLYLTSGKADWLSGRYVSANWDLGEVESKFKDAIIEKKALVSRLALP